MDFDSLIQEGDAIQQGMQSHPPAPIRAVPHPQSLSLADKLLAMVPTGLVNNPAVDVARRVTTEAAGPEIGAAQLAANTASALHVPGFGDQQNLSSLVTGQDSPGLASRFNSAIDEVNKKNAEAGKNLPAPIRIGSDIAGSVISPTNLLLAGILKPATTLGSAAIQGAKIGAVQGITSPVENANESYWMPKAVQTGLSTVTGAVLQPILNAVGNKVATYVAKFGANPKDSAAQADKMIQDALAESGQTVNDLPQTQLAAVQASVQDALAQGKKLDAAAALRKSDFDAEKIAPTLGQITRDPTQFAEEQNVKGVLGVGAPISKTLQEGNQAVTRGISRYGVNAQEAPAASQTLAQALRGYGEGQQQNVRSLYTAARQSSGAELDIPLQGLAQDYADVLDTFGDKVPGAVRAKFASFGLDPNVPANQQKVFNFDEADKLRKIINSHVGNDAATNRALGKLRDALNRAQTGVDAAGGPFAPAVSAARDFFKQQGQIPALESSMSGPVDDRFVMKSVINNPSTPQVQQLAALLREQAPDAYNEVRQQIGAHLSRAAFGENVAGDKQVAQESFNKALRQLGTGKLEAFFTPDEVAQMRRLGRIASYQVSPPAASTVNYSNSAAAMANLLRAASRFPFAPGSLRYAGDKIMASGALNPAVPVSPNLSDAQRLMLARALTAVTGAGAATATGSVGQQP